jgi:hypothetical protein
MSEGKMDRTIQEFDIGGRYEGTEPLMCVECSRLWGLDDIVVPDHMKNVERKEGDALGYCPYCKDMDNEKSLVYYARDILPPSEAPTGGDEEDEREDTSEGS